MSRLEVVPPDWLRETGSTSTTALHQIPVLPELHRTFSVQLDKLLPGAPWLVLIYGSDDCAQVACRSKRLQQSPDAGGCPFPDDHVADLNAWEAVGALRLPLQFREVMIGELQVGGDPMAALQDEALLGELAELLRHYAVAVANLTLGALAREDAARYCAGVVAVEEGLGLLQEESTQLLTLRLLDLMVASQGAPAGALFLCRGEGADRSMELAQVHGVPEAALEGLVDPSGPGPAWLLDCLDLPPMVRRCGAEHPDVQGLPMDLLPPETRAVTILPVRHFTHRPGLVLLFSADGGPAGLAPEPDLFATDHLGSLAAMILQRVEREQQALRQRETEVSLRIADDLQRHLEAGPPPHTDHLECAAWRRSAASLRSDYLEVLRGSDGQLGVIFTDASGVGIEPALLTTALRSCWRLDWGDTLPGPLLARLHRQIREDAGDDGGFVAAASLRFATGGRELLFAGSGHPPLLLFRVDGQVQELLSDAPPLGFPDAVTPATQRVSLTPGDVLVALSNGISHAIQLGSGEPYGVERLQRLIPGVRRRSAQGIADAIAGDVRRACGGVEPEDDQSLLVIRVKA